MLTLANGDRILMTPAMKAFFEPENLNNASPATVSRAGIIYVSDSELGWQPLVASWLQACPGSALTGMHACAHAELPTSFRLQACLPREWIALQALHASTNLSLLVNSSSHK